MDRYFAQKVSPPNLLYQIKGKLQTEQKLYWYICIMYVTYKFLSSLTPYLY